VSLIHYVYAIARDALYAFLADDGWAIASHIALSTLMAFFPFLIVITSLAGLLGSEDLADQATNLFLSTWPQQVAGPISGEIRNVLTGAHGEALTYGVALAIYFASNGVESLRVGLNRAYSVLENRSWYWLRLESIGYTLIAAVVWLALAFFIVLAPLILANARRYMPLLEPNDVYLTFSRYGIAAVALVIALFILHKWLPAGRRSLLDILPGILVTIAGSLIAGILFGQYLQRFAENYVTTYAGLASVMIALVFLYFIASVFVYGGELNAAIIKARRLHRMTHNEDAIAGDDALPERVIPRVRAD
jgi:membrane protein